MSIRFLLRITSFSFVMIFIFSCSFLEDTGSLNNSCGDKDGTVLGNNTVTCGGQTYKTTQIGEQIWMAENLNYKTGNSECYTEHSENCAKFGRLYDWSTAMGFESGCNSNACKSNIKPKHRGICPEGWHIPTPAEWEQLFSYAGGARYLRAMSNEWQTCDICDIDDIDNCDFRMCYIYGDPYGFSALPAGHYNPKCQSCDYMNMYHDTNWWVAKESTEGGWYKDNGAYFCRVGDIDRIGDGVGCSGMGEKFYHFSVRCVKD
jgi:uncharacterized protein (TIGR02145 family)